MPNNRHRVDELADLRQQIKTLRLTEGALRASVLAPTTRTTSQATKTKKVLICETTVERLDLAMMRQELGSLFLRPYMRETTVTRVQIKPTRKPRRTK